MESTFKPSASKYCFAIIKSNIIMFCCFVLLTYPLKAQTISIWPKEISFNYEAGNSNDAVTLRHNSSTLAPVPEFIRGGRNEKCAYVKN
jgi:hypothetical protein